MPIAGDVDARQDDFLKAGVHQLLNMFNHAARRNRSAVPASKWNDAKRASMVTAILHFNKRAGFAGIGRDKMRRGLRYRHNIRHDNGAVGSSNYIAQQRRVLFFMVAENAGHFGHVLKSFWLHLRSAARHPHLCLRTAFVGLSNGLAGLTDRFIGNCATVDDNEIVLAGKLFGQGIAFGQIEAASHVDDLRLFKKRVHPKSSQSACPAKT